MNTTASNSMRESLGQSLRWNKTCDALQNALQEWDALSKKDFGPSHEDQLLNEMKTLLKKLQNQIEDLS